MPVESAADRAVFVNPDEFGATGSYLLAAGGASDVDGQFDNGDVDTFGGAGAGVGMVSKSPSFLCQTASLPAGAKGGGRDRITVADTIYAVQVIRDDGQGMSTLQLEVAS